MGLFTLAYILLMLILLVFVTLNVSFSFVTYLKVNMLNLSV